MLPCAPGEVMAELLALATDPDQTARMPEPGVPFDKASI
jgi:hypothetical protein